VGLRVLTAALVLVAAIADAASSPQLAFYALLAEDGRIAQALLWALVLTLVVAGAATRSPALLAGGVPVVGATALTACLALLSLEGVLAAVVEFRRRTG
jgi:hypothetical protein